MHTKFALFGEVLLTGVLVALASLGVVTALPAAIAGSAHLRRYLAGTGGGRSAVLHDLTTALTRLRAASVGLPTVAVLMYWNITTCLRAPVAGGRGVAVACAGITAAVVVTAVRMVGSWAPTRPAGSGAAVREAALLGVSDPAGTALLAATVLGVAAFCWMLPLLVLLAPGLLVFAAIAVEHRRLSRCADGAPSVG
jgi:hypothetical protein